MRTTISLSESLYAEARQCAGERSFSDFASEALHERVLFLRRRQLEQELEVGYRSEAASPSLDPEWSSFEVEGL
jgi:hypothetical protein